MKWKSSASSRVAYRRWDATVSRSAQLGDDRQLALAAEHLLRLHVEFARTYRAWLARRIIGRPPFLPLGGPDSMSV